MTLSIWTSIAISVLLCSASARDDEAPVISTEGGRVSGVAEEATEGKLFYSYYGIPFAEPPVGDLRFKDPVASRGWSGIRDGSTMPSPCVNLPFGIMVFGVKIPAEQMPGKEDCLYLNVFMPKAAAAVASTKRGSALPVMVFIHGGGYFGGAAEEYLPHVLLNKDIVLVVIQYRLGFLGFLSTEDSVIPGNFGLKDQTAALQWVQRNIHNFGGDPKRVTIFGESAGGASVHYQMLTPKAKGLFTGVIMQSGSAIAPWATNSDHKEWAAKVGSFVGCSLDRGSQAFLACMQNADARKINILSQDLLEWFIVPIMAAPRVDGDYIPDHPAKLMKEGRYNKVNLMSGITANEGACLTQPMYNTQRHLIDELRAKFSTVGPLSFSLSENELSSAKQIYNYYLGGSNFGPPYAEEFTQMMGDMFFNLHHDLVTSHHAREEGVSTYRYEMAHRGQMSFGDIPGIKIGRHWVPHADDLLYLFRGGPLLTPPDQPADRPLDLSTAEDLFVRNVMITTWTNFAYYGNPTPDDSLGFRWDAAADEDDFRYLEISATPSMKSDSRKDTRKFLLSVPTTTNVILNPSLITEDGLDDGRRGQERDEL